MPSFATSMHGASRLFGPISERPRATADRLLLAIGVDELLARIPRAALEAVRAMEGELDDSAIAELALAVHGPRVLKEHHDVLRANGLEPPDRWSGSRAAVAFVRDLGFGVEYAGFESRGPDRFLEVEGPPEIGPLHDYQEVVVEEIRQVIRGEGGSRGLLSLPTGAGKTRVTIEALIDAMAAGDLESPILWVAQTEELCEQAVETWSELWRGKGPRDRLTISRLRAHFEAEEVEHGQQVVVATNAKLDAGVFKKTSYDWLKSADLHRRRRGAHVHRPVLYAPSRMAGTRGAPEGTGRTADRAHGDSIPGHERQGDEAARRSLWRSSARPQGARRGRRLSAPAADRNPLRGRSRASPGCEIKLSDAELNDLQRQLLRLPDAAVRALAADVERNRTLIDHIAAQPAGLADPALRRLRRSRTRDGGVAAQRRGIGGRHHRRQRQGSTSALHQAVPGRRAARPRQLQQSSRPASMLRACVLSTSRDPPTCRTSTSR